MTVQLTEPQEARVRELKAVRGRVYADSVQGKGIVAAFRRYLESGDANKITNALYVFLHVQCGFIAHFNLHGFRCVYADPADLIEGTEEAFGPHCPSNETVYSDGMCSSEIYAEMEVLMDEHRERLRERRSEAHRDLDVATAQALAERHGFELVAKAG